MVLKSSEATKYVLLHRQHWVERELLGEQKPIRLKKIKKKSKLLPIGPLEAQVPVRDFLKKK